MDRTRDLANDLSIGIALNIAIALSFDRDRDLIASLGLDQDIAIALLTGVRPIVQDLNKYLFIKNRLLQCLYTECEVSPELRQQLLDKLLEVPEVF